MMLSPTRSCFVYNALLKSFNTCLTDSFVFPNLEDEQYTLVGSILSIRDLLFLQLLHRSTLLSNYCVRTLPL
jgi:hypothetical protein